MFKPLIRTIPALSGNIKLSCFLDNLEKIDHNNFECFVRSAKLTPLSSSLFSKFLPISLLNSSYEWDVKSFYAWYSEYFWNLYFDFNKNDYKKLDKHNINNIRNVDLEFGVNRVSWQQNNKQFCFFAPIYVESINDIPDNFTLTIEFNSSIYKTTKIVKVKINDNLSNPANYLGNYINRYLKKIDDNVIYCDSSKAYIRGIDIINGGFVNKIENDFVNLTSKQHTILNFDNMISDMYQKNNVVIRQILPLAFYFNVNSLLSDSEKEQYKNAEIKISGKWFKDNKQVSLYNFSINYTEFYEKIFKLNNESGLIEYDYPDNIINVMDCPSPGLHDANYKNYRFSNKISPNFCQWKLKYSDDEQPYITNINYAFSYNCGSNIKYYRYPGKHIKSTAVASINRKNNDYYVNLILPFGNGRKYYDKYPIFYKNYLKSRNKFCSDWFELMNCEQENAIEKCIINNDAFKDVKDNKVFFNGILYNLSNIYDSTNLNEKIDKFGVFITLNFKSISNKAPGSEYYSNVVINKQYGKYIKYPNVHINDDTLNNDKSELFSRLEESYVSDEFATNQIFSKNLYNNGDFINLSDYNIDYYDINRFFNVKDICNLSKFYNFGEYVMTYCQTTKSNKYSKIPIYRISQIKYNVVDNLTYNIISCYNLENNIYLSSKDNVSKTLLTNEIINALPKDALANGYTFYNESQFISYNNLLETAYTYYCTTYSSSLYNLSNDMFNSRIQNIWTYSYYLVNDISNSIDDYLYNPVITEINNDVICKETFVKNYGLTKRFYGDNIPKDKIDLDNDVLFIDPFNYNNIVKRYNNTWLQNDTEKLSYIVNDLNKKQYFGKFLNVEHFKYYVKYIYDDPDASGKNKFDALKSIYIRRRNLYNNVNEVKYPELNVYDEYIPLSEYYDLSILNNDNIDTIEYDKLIEDIYNNLVFENGVFYWKEFKVYKNDSNSIKVKSFEKFNNSKSYIPIEYLDKFDNICSQQKSNKVDSSVFTFDLCYKKDFVKINKEIYKLINLEENNFNGAPYKDLYIFRLEKDSEYNSNLKYYYSDKKSKYLSDNKECLTPLFYSIFMQDKEDTKIYCEYNLNCINEIKCGSEKFYRDNANNIVCMFDISNLKEKYPYVSIGNKHYYFYNEWQNLENKDSYSYLSCTYDKYSSPKSRFTKFIEKRNVAYISGFTYETQNFTSVSYLYFNKDSWDNNKDMYGSYEFTYFVDTNSLKLVYCVSQYQTESKIVNIIPQYGYMTSYMDVDNLGLYDQFKLNTYSYINETTGEKTNYAFYLIEVDLNNTLNTINMSEKDNNYIKYVTHINGHNIFEHPEYIYDVYKQILPFITNDPLNTLLSNSYLLNFPKLYSIPLKYSSYLINKENNLYDIKFNKFSKNELFLERYLDDIKPLILPIDSSITTYQLKYKDINETFKITYNTNDILYKDNIFINDYKGIRVYNKNKTYYNWKDLEYKHFNDNKFINLEEEIEIEISDLLTSIELVLMQTNNKTLEIFSDYIKNNSNINFSEDEILFLFNQYNIKYLHNGDKLSINLSEKLYKLKYRFSLR